MPQHLRYYYVGMSDQTLFCFQMEVVCVDKNGNEGFKPETSIVPIKRGVYGLGNMGIEGDPVEEIENVDHFSVVGSSENGVQIQHKAKEPGYLRLADVAKAKKVVQNEIFTLDGNGVYELGSGSATMKLISHEDASQRIENDSADEEEEADEDDADGEMDDFIVPDTFDEQTVKSLARIANCCVIAAAMDDEGAKTKNIKKAAVEEAAGEDMMVLPTLKKASKQKKEVAKHRKQAAGTRQLRMRDSQAHIDYVKTIPGMMSIIEEMDAIHALGDEAFRQKTPKRRRVADTRA